MGKKRPVVNLDCGTLTKGTMHAGGGGPKAELLQKMIAEEGLEGRVQMVGPVPHEKARDLLASR